MQDELAVAESPALESGVDALLEPLMADALAALDGRAPLLAGMVRYHLGYVDLDLHPIDPRTIDRGKRIRPAVTLLVAGAAGGDPVQAAPVAAAIELLHNFTLIHDDIQDESATRRHRPTVRHTWGDKQAINAGDALFAVAHLPLFQLPASGVSAERTIAILDAFERMTIEIVEGQTLDLGFETREDVTADAYLEMISGKTSAIIRFAAWAGATIAGADATTAARWGDFGLELGLGFQIHDDLLGVWGTQAETGKRQADDIRRRKKSYPFLLLRERLDLSTLAELNAIYAQDDVSEKDVTRVLSLMDTRDVRRNVERVVTHYHDSAAAVLANAARNPVYQRQLQALVESLATRTS
ncbi:MAG: polyprenyl synthetase family protein [Chloroflexota bacterium]|nr:polyprenyl synthetase family protein [Chloroflexota bacterium]